MSVLLLGLNHFKELNEVYGHLGCDEALSQIGSRIRDSANSGDVFARIGDDEFALCLAGMDPENALRVAGALLEVVKKPVAARLLGTDTAAVQADRLGAAQALAARLQAAVVLKGAGSVLAHPDGTWDINASGNPGLASAGTGDVLAGFAGAFLAQGLDAKTALRLAVCLHGAAADALRRATAAARSASPPPSSRRGARAAQRALRCNA